MSALAHYLEEEGVPAVAISLIRLHSEKIGPPRALWVPFELGRPLGAANDEQFQFRVIAAALRLLETAPGPAVLEDFPDDDPTAIDLPGWRPPVDFTAGAIDIGEREALDARYARKCSPSRRSTSASSLPIGGRRLALAVSTIDDCARLLSAGLAGSLPASPDPSANPVQALRWAVDDLKAYYLEAMSADGAMPSSRQMQSWFWDHTLVARAIIALRRQLLASDEKRSQAIGRMNLVPGAQVQRLGLQ